MPASDVETRTVREIILECDTVDCPRAAAFHGQKSTDSYGECFAYCRSCAISFARSQLLHSDDWLHFAHLSWLNWTSGCLDASAHRTLDVKVREEPILDWEDVF